MQELMVYAGHLECYDRCNEVLERFLSIEVSAAQVYRVTNKVSESLIEEQDQTERLLSPIEKSDVLYAEMDGSMVCTREDGWKEVKLGRLFKGSDCLNPNSEHACLSQSQYVAQFGNSHTFGKRMEQVISAYGNLKHRLVFITDGATWIREWIADHYPCAVAVLDYYHACEHLHQFADTAFKERQQKELWCKEQKELMLDSMIDKVINNIMMTEAQEEQKLKLINYYGTNKHRMDYKNYRTMGCGIIGSGAIESAHRTVIQKRMKLSGQRWSHQGIRNMLRLRVLSMNKQWYKIIEATKYPKTRAA